MNKTSIDILNEKTSFSPTFALQKAKQEFSKKKSVLQAAIAFEAFLTKNIRDLTNEDLANKAKSIMSKTDANGQKILKKVIERADVKTDKSAAEEYEEERATKSGARAYSNKEKGSSVVFDKRADKIVNMVAKNNFNWDTFTNAFYGKGDFSKVVKSSSIPIEGGVMMDVKSTEVKHKARPKSGDEFRFIDFIYLKEKKGFEAFKKKLGEKLNKELSNEEAATLYNNWINEVVIKELNSARGKALIKKAIIDNKDNVIEIGNKKKTLRGEDFKLSFSKGGFLSPSKGFPKLDRMLLNVVIPKSAITVEDELFDFTREIING